MRQIKSSRGEYFLDENNSLFKTKNGIQERISNFYLQKVGYFVKDGEAIRIFRLTNSKNVSITATFTVSQLINKQSWSRRLESFEGEGGFFWFGTMTDLANLKEELYDLKKIEFFKIVEWVEANRESICPFFYDKKLYR